MAIKLTSLRDVTSRGKVTNREALANDGLVALSAKNESGVDFDALVAQTTGFHLYGDLIVKRRLEKADTMENAKLLLEAIEEVISIASAFTEVEDIWLFEAQGTRFHLFIDAENLDENAVNKLVAYCSYLAKSVDNRVRAIIPDDYEKFSMAADHGRAVVISTGREGDSSVISLGNAANIPAKRLSRNDIADGTVALPIELARLSRALTKECSEQSGSSWVHINVLLKRFELLAKEELELLESVAMTARVPRKQDIRNIEFGAIYAANSAESVVASVQNPLVLQALVFRADLHGFTKRVEEAYRRGPSAITEVVQEFLDILKLPEAFERSIGNPAVRLSWAGDCYTLIIQPRNFETYSSIRTNLPAVACYLWHDPDGKVNAKRDAALQAVAGRHQWSVGIAGGTESEGRILLANVATTERRFLIAAGWGSVVSLEAQDAAGLAETESALHVEDHRELSEKFRNAFLAWSEQHGLRKATLKRLSDAHNGTRVEVTSQPTKVLVTPRPYFS